MNLIFLGPPGAGKGTHASRLMAQEQIPQISTGDMLRKSIREGTSLGLKAKQFIDAGELVPDEVVIGLVKERLKEADCQKGFILDGFPRTVEQAEALSSFVKIDKVVNIFLADEIILKRLSGRRVCPSCNGTFHVSRLADEKICPDCGKDLIQRKDDQPETIKNRLDVYARQTAPLIAYYQAKGLLVTVPGDGSVDENYQGILKVLGINE